MNDLIERRLSCPYCGEMINVLIDLSEPHQSYIEDCQVCCRPIDFDVTVEANGDVAVVASRDDE